MRALILSDIHGNLEALEAVLFAAEGKYDEIWNLGDMVGYGASPNQVIDRIRPISAVVVRGNHDRVCCGLTSPNGFNPVARAAALWTRAELTPENLDWLRNVPQGPISPNFEGITCAHGSPLDEDRYILTMRDAWAPLQQSPAPITFFGHTHIQGGFSQRDHNWHDLRPAYERRTDTRSEPVQWTLPLEPETRHLINPGSVGQPRDHDWRAAYAIFDSEAAEIVFHRTPYDVMTTQGRILMAELPERLASRLREGR
ncbi:metallophosphoesterase family protein [Granulicella tundricola]|uniref:Metallophosphoesterase n=1 Tax=Granulicella tundricola (strain ATCC BAA-1859 / DSM 23138 / MP5ACTX9) TaxID=1198114 RepID=E8X4T0_GRATM|nr:metallophosphoesterase family protein [Granulicella tundricola]ADW70569.1 metallophosphoesterase [Granulicella tundricola MP5ACTX9]